MTFTQTREPAGTPRTAQTAGSRTTPTRGAAIRALLTSTACSFIAATIVVIADAGTGGDATCVIAALCLFPFLMPAYTRRPRKHVNEDQADNELPYEPGWWLR